MPDDRKPWYQSMTIQGGAISAITGALMFLPIQLPEDAQTQVAGYVTALFNLVGFVMVIVGRIKAKTSISR